VTEARLHPRVSVSGLCFPGSSAAEVLSRVAEIGAQHTTLAVGVVREAGAAEARARAEDCGIGVEALIRGTGPDLHDPATWAAVQEELIAAVDLAAAVGASTIYMLTGSRRRLSWREAVDRFATFMAPCLEFAAASDITLAVEPANTLFADLTFVHTAATASALTHLVPGLAVCLDLFHTWTEFDLETTIATDAARVSLVQVTDYVFGDRSLPAKAVPGDGAVPIDTIVGWLCEAGYTGVFDLELNGPRIEAEGHLAAARRGARALSGILEDRSGALGAPTGVRVS
jgi:sugar phosphate isomerase/epimerase